MMKRFLLLFSIVIVNGFLLDIQAQDPQFSQFYANPLYLNPAFAGTAKCPRICMNYRNQWPNLSGTYVTYSASYDQHIDAISGGIGLIVTQDDQARGVLKTTTANLIYSYQANINRYWSIKAALQAGFFQKKIDKNKLNFGDMIDPRRGFIWNTNENIPKDQISSLDLSSGLLIFSERFFIGFAAHHLAEPNEGLQGTSQLPRKFTAHAGGKINFSKGGGDFISPNILFKQQENFTQLNLGMYLVKGNFVGGIWYRNFDAFILLLGFQTGNFKIGYSYDVTISRLAVNTAGSHELSLQLQFECRKKKKKFRLTSCPSF